MLSKDKVWKDKTCEKCEYKEWVVGTCYCMRFPKWEKISHSTRACAEYKESV